MTCKGTRHHGMVYGKHAVQLLYTQLTDYVLTSW